MELSLLLQYLVVAGAVLASLYVVAKQQFPGSVRRLRVALALTLLREGRPGWMQSLGRWISPVRQSANGACDGCGPTPKL